MTKMDINKLTIGEAQKKMDEYKAGYEELAKLFGKASLEAKTNADYTGKYCIVRTYSAGVFAGEIIERNGREVTMNNARRIWYWKGAASLSQLSLDGTSSPEECKFPAPVDNIELLEVIEILQCTDKARKSIEGVNIWRE